MPGITYLLTGVTNQHHLSFKRTLERIDSSFYLKGSACIDRCLKYLFKRILFTLFLL